jgi:hypothetical protein
MIDWDALLFAPVSATFGVDVTFILADDPSPFPLSLRVLDMTGGASTGLIGGTVNGRDMAMDTIRPAADVRAAALTANGVTVSDLLRSTLTMNGRDWIVKSFIPLPAPNGEGQGEYRLVLEEVEV